MLTLTLINSNDRQFSYFPSQITFTQGTCFWFHWKLSVLATGNVLYSRCCARILFLLPNLKLKGIDIFSYKNRELRFGKQSKMNKALNNILSDKEEMTIASKSLRPSVVSLPIQRQINHQILKN